MKVRQHNSTLHVDTDKPLRRKTPLRRTAGPDRSGPISLCSKEQRESVKGKACLGCGREASAWLAIDPAHLWPAANGGDCGSEYDVVPLCRDASGDGCHRAYDEHRLRKDNLLATLVADWERWKLHVCHVLHEHSLPVPLLERLASARISWESVVIEGAGGE